MEPTKNQIINCVFYEFNKKIEWNDQKWILIDNNQNPQHELVKKINNFISEITIWYHNIKSFVEKDLHSKFSDQKFTLNGSESSIQIYLNSKPTDFNIYLLIDTYSPYFEVSISPPSDGWK